MESESKSAILYENLDTSFVNLWALLRKLSQRGFIGRVHVELKDYAADIFLTGSSSPLVHEVDRAAATDTLEEGALHRLVLRVRETPGTISVFEGADEAVSVQGADNLKTEPGDAQSGQERGRSEPQVHDADAITESNPAGQPILTPEIEIPRSVMSADNEELRLVTASLAAEPAGQSTEPVDEIEWSATLKASGELIGAIERAVTGAGADFLSYFNGARLALADDYVFLDPLSGEFSYSNSVVTFSGELSGGSYVIGLSETLRRVVDGVATGDRARRVRERVALELFSVARKRREILERSGFLSQLDRIAGTKVL